MAIDRFMPVRGKLFPALAAWRQSRRTLFSAPPFSGASGSFLVIALLTAALVPASRFLESYPSERIETFAMDLSGQLATDR